MRRMSGMLVNRGPGGAAARPAVALSVALAAGLVAGLAVGLVTLLSPPAFAAVHVVVQSGLTFVPDDLTIQVGDTVQWNWASGSHTVTNGSSLADPQLGVLFDAPLNSTNTNFTHTFTTAGDVPYLCRPHAGFGMTGIVRVDAPSAVGDLPGNGLAALDQNHPNPFNPSTVIGYRLAAPAKVSLRVFDARGRLVRTLLEDIRQGDGEHRTAWDGADDQGRPAPAGVYLYRLQAGQVTQTRRMTLVK